MRTISETWDYLETQGYDVPRAADGEPRVAVRRPAAKDADLYLQFFRTGLHGDDLSQLSLPRTYFGRSSLTRVSFRKSDLSESSMCSNDFTDCDFTDANLRDCDVRASVFTRCSFRGADLSGADLRHSTFKTCTFEGAVLRNAVATDGQGPLLPLTEEQRRSVRWTDDAGEAPPIG